MNEKVNQSAVYGPRSTVHRGQHKLSILPTIGRLWTVDCGLLFFAILLLISSCTPKEPIVLRQIKEVVADATSQPTLKAEAIFYNPNNTRMQLKKIDVDIYIGGKKVGEVDQEMETLIPAHDEFTVPIEVKLAMKDFGFLDTLFGMIGGKKLEIQYKGSLKLTYHGFPIRVPVDYKDEIRLNF